MIRKPRLKKRQLEKIQQNAKHFSVNQLKFLTNQILKEILEVVKYDNVSSGFIKGDTYSIQATTLHTRSPKMFALELKVRPNDIMDYINMNYDFREPLDYLIPISYEDLPNVDNIINIVLFLDDLCYYLSLFKIF